MDETLGIEDVEVLECETAFKGHFRVDRYRLRHRKFVGGWGPEIRREVFERGHAVAVLLYDPDRDALVMIEQFRVGALVAGWEPWLIEIVAGIIEEGEEPADVARREAFEESGCVVTDLIPAARYLVSPGGTSETVQVYCGRVDSARAGGIHGLEEEGEDIKVMVIPADDALEMLARGEFTNSASLVGLQWFALNRARLRQHWCGVGAG